MQRIGFLGAGQMATALAKGFLDSGLVTAEAIVAFDPFEQARTSFAGIAPGITIATSNAVVVEKSDVVFLSIKPQQMDTVLKDIKPSVSPSKLFISIAAGVTLAKISAGLGSERIVRVMPNTPCLVGEGASAFACGKAATADDSALVAKLLGAVGTTCQLEEKLLDAVTGLSGSGPAYAFVVIEALADGGVRMGLPRSVALQLAAQTLLGAAKMVLAGEHPAVLKDRVASPGGTTIAGLQALEERGLRGALIAAVEAATKRSQELG